MLYTIKELARKISCSESCLRTYLGRAEFSHLKYIRGQGIEIKNKDDVRLLKQFVLNRLTGKKKRYELKTGELSYTCPEQSLIPLAQHKALECGKLASKIVNVDLAIDFLESIGIRVRRVK